MADDIAIRVENLSKRYRIGAKEVVHDTLAGMLSDWVKRPGLNMRRLRRLTQFSDDGQEPEDILWALKDVSFEVKRGEVVGIIGRNGAGKSTLLKILSRITHPTSGRIELNGRVSSLLEVGNGYHPELTGRENIYLNGTILGMRKAEIDRKFDEIVEFSGVEKFIDTPVKRYSSGMRVRLAFSVAAHLEPEILLIDEVLSVGDVEFQNKSIGKMESVAQSGRTVLFVSHNMGAVAKLCQRGILLTDGRVDIIGPIDLSITQYLSANWGQTDSLILDRIEYISPLMKIDLITVNSHSSDFIHLPADSNVLEIQLQGTVSEKMKVDLELRFYDVNGMPLGFYSPGHLSGTTKWLEPGEFMISQNVYLPKVTRGEYNVSIFLTDPMKSTWMAAPNSFRLSAEGAVTAGGQPIDYSKGNGWVLLP